MMLPNALRLLPPFRIITVLIGVSFAGCLYQSIRYRKKKYTVAALILYSVLILEVTVFGRSPNSTIIIKMEPFWTYVHLWHNGISWMFWELVYNLIMLAPLGYLIAALLQVVVRKKKYLLLGALLAGLGFSILIEGLQFVLKRGTVEVDDLIHNTIGAVLGAILYIAGKHFFNCVRKRGKEVI